MRFDTIQKRALRRPWRSFAILLDNGVRVPVRHPESIYFLKHDEIVVYENGTSWFFEASAVSAVQRQRPLNPDYS